MEKSRWPILQTRMHVSNSSNTPGLLVRLIGLVRLTLLPILAYCKRMQLTFEKQVTSGAIQKFLKLISKYFYTQISS